MKSVRQRIDRLEDRLAPQATNQILIVVADAAQKLALDGDSCVQILREAGRIDSASPISVVDLGYIPDGLNVAELERTFASSAAAAGPPEMPHGIVGGIDLNAADRCSDWTGKR